MPSWTIHKPVKKTDYYLAKLADPKTGKVRLTVSECQWMQLHPKEDGGFLLRIWFPPNHAILEQIKAIDTFVMEETIAKLSEWFPANMSSQQLQDMFRPSLHYEHGTATFLISPWKECICYQNGELKDDITQLFVRRDHQVRLELEAQGVLFYRKKFGVRWLVRRVQVSDPVSESLDEPVDRETIEQEWEEELSSVFAEMEESKHRYRQKIAALELAEKEMQEQLLAVAQAPMGEAWHAQLEVLRSRIRKFETGA
jgi:hypothetical protein